MSDRREKSFFAPLMVTGGLVLLLGLASCVLPVMKCAWCLGTGTSLWRDFDCSRCSGRGSVPLIDVEKWSVR